MMININDILQWKQQFGDIYQMEIQEQHFIFRPLGREEYKQVVMMDLELGEFQEMICLQAMIHPDDYDYSKGIAGIAEVISDAVLDASGLHMGQAKQLLDDFRIEMENYDYQVDCMIHEAFPEYTLDEISTWPVRKTMYYLSRSEWILQTLKGVPIHIADEVSYEDEEPIYAPKSQEPPSPPQRPIRKELVEGPEQKESTQSTQQSSNQNTAQSEEELLAMLAGAGGKVSRPSKDMSEIKPELSWFQYMDELKGEFD